jgi:hypothetical protein
VYDIGGDTTDPAYRRIRCLFSPHEMFREAAEMAACHQVVPIPIFLFPPGKPFNDPVPGAEMTARPAFEAGFRV